MKKKKDDFVQIMLKAMEASMLSAIDTAIRYQKTLVVWKDGKIAKVQPDELLRQMKKTKKRKPKK